MFVIRFNGVPNFIRYDCFDWVCSSDLGTVLDTKRVFSVRWLMTVLVSPEVTPCGCRVTLCGCRVTPCGWFPRAHVHVVGMLRFMSKTLTNRTCPHFKKKCSCACFCLYGPFDCISFHKFSRQLSAFSLCSCSLISALWVLSTVYLSIKVSLSPDIIICGWLGLKHQPTNELHARWTGCNISVTYQRTNSMAEPARLKWRQPSTDLFFRTDILNKYCIGRKKFISV